MMTRNPELEIHNPEQYRNFKGLKVNAQGADVLILGYCTLDFT